MFDESRFGIEMLTVVGLPPVEFVKLAESLGCGNISILVQPCPGGFPGYPPFDLASDAPLRRALREALLDSGVTVTLGDGYCVCQGIDIRDLADRQLGAMLELGVKRVNIVSIDPDLSRTLDQYAVFAEHAIGASMEEVVSEFAPVLTVRDLPTALRAVDHVGRPDFKLLIDTMHFGRTGGTGAELAEVEPSLIGCMQLSDAPSISDADYMQEALTDRKPPGGGELPLSDMLAATPRDCIVSLEVPQLARVMAGESMPAIVGQAVEAARALLRRTARR